MENLTKPIGLTEISYPVYCLSKERPLFIDGVYLYLRSYKDEDGLLFDRYRIVDDINVSGKTLATRRLRLMKNKVKLQPLGKAVFFLGDLIKLAAKYKWFIDSTGQVFEYTKTRKVLLEFRRIVKQMSIKTGGSILELEGIPIRFKTLYSPREDEIYAGVLKDKMGYILYGVYNTLHSSTWRKI